MFFFFFCFSRRVRHKETAAHANVFPVSYRAPARFAGVCLREAQQTRASVGFGEWRKEMAIIVTCSGSSGMVTMVPILGRDLRLALVRQRQSTDYQGPAFLSLSLHLLFHFFLFYFFPTHKIARNFVVCMHFSSLLRSNYHNKCREQQHTKFFLQTGKS